MLTLRERGVDARGQRAAVIGAASGGVMAAALPRPGARVTLVNRGQERGSLAVGLLHLPFIPLTTSRAAATRSSSTHARGGDGDALPFPVQRLRRDAVVVDLVYRDGPTPLISARAAPEGFDRGWDMLMAQARHPIELMTGMEMPDELTGRPRTGASLAVSE